MKVIELNNLNNNYKEEINDILKNNNKSYKIESNSESKKELIKKIDELEIDINDFDNRSIRDEIYKDSDMQKLSKNKSNGIKLLNNNSENIILVDQKYIERDLKIEIEILKESNNN